MEYISDPIVRHTVNWQADLLAGWGTIDALKMEKRVGMLKPVKGGFLFDSIFYFTRINVKEGKAKFFLKTIHGIEKSYEYKLPKKVVDIFKELAKMK